MPILKIFTNVSKDYISGDFVSKLIPALVNGVKKDAQKFTCLVQTDCILRISGNSSLPAVVASLESIGNLGPEQNKLIVKLLSDVVTKELGVAAERFILTFHDISAHDIAIDGSTVAAFEY